MKKRFWAIPLMAIAIACTVLLSACGGPSVEELIREDIDNAFGEFSSDNPEFMDAMLESADGSFEQMGIDPQEFADAYFKGFDHKVKDVVVDEKAGTAEATVTVKMKSLSAIMMDFANKFEEYVATLDPSAVGSEEELYAQAGQLLMDAVNTNEPAETDCVFEYQKDEDGGWSAVEGTEEQILNAMQ